MRLLINRLSIFLLQKIVLHKYVFYDFILHSKENFQITVEMFFIFLSRQLKYQNFVESNLQKMYC